MARLALAPSRYSVAVTSARPMEPTGRIWPNGEFGVSFRPRAGVEDVFEGGAKYEDGQLYPLDLTNAPNSHKKPRKPRGHRGITGYGRKMVRNAAALLQRDYGKDQLSFLTLTLPEMPEADQRAVGRNWAEIVRVFVQRLRRNLIGRGLPGEVVQVVELQGNRYKERGGLPLHLHMVFVGRHRRSAWAVAPKQVRKWWAGSCSRYISVELDWNNCENLVRVRKCVSSYLSKYMSKGSGDILSLIEAGWGDSIPTAWWGVSRGLAKQIHRDTLSGAGAMAYLAALIDDGMAEGFDYLYPIRISFDDGLEYTIGWAGKLKSDFLSEIRQAVLGK